VKRDDPEFDAKLAALAAQAPPLTREQADRIRALLLPPDSAPYPAPPTRMCARIET